MDRVERQARELLGTLIKYRSAPSGKTYVFRDRGELDAKTDKEKIPKLVARSNYKGDQFQVHGIANGEKYPLKSGHSGDPLTVSLSAEDTNRLVRNIDPKTFRKTLWDMRKEEITVSNYVPVEWFDRVEWDKHSSFGGKNDKCNLRPVQSFRPHELRVAHIFREL